MLRLCTLSVAYEPEDSADADDANDVRQHIC